MHYCIIAGISGDGISGDTILKSWGRSPEISIVSPDTKIEAGETIVKSINIVNLIDRFAPAYFFVGKPSKKDIEENYKVQLYVEIYFDEHLKIVEKYQSEWLPMQ